jgi:hypothetical protein
MARDWTEISLRSRHGSTLQITVTEVRRRVCDLRQVFCRIVRTPSLTQLKFSIDLPTPLQVWSYRVHGEWDDHIWHIGMSQASDFQADEL